MSSIKTAYETLVTINPGTTIQGVASGNLWQSAAQDWTTNLDLDTLLQVQIKTGSGALAGSKVVNIYVAGSVDGTHWPDNVAATEGALTVDSLSNLLPCGRPISVTTVSKSYWSQPASVVNCFGGTPPKKFVIILENQTGAAWDSTDTNFQLLLLGAYATSV